MRIYVAFAIILSIGITASAQVDKTWSYLLSVKNHNFYDNGVYDVDNTNQATAYGLGVQAQQRLSKRIGWSFGYSLALADSIQANEGWTRNALYHQLEGNITLQPKNYKRVKPYLFSGYAFNIIPQLTKISERATGININIGGGLEVKLVERIGLAYQTTYGYSLVDNIPYNFRHQFGVVLYPSRFKGRTPSQTTISLKDEIVQFVNVDSLQMVIDSLYQIIAKTTESIPEIKTISHHPSETNTKRLNVNRQQDVPVFLNDSIRLITFQEYTFISRNQRVVSLGFTRISSGYYLMNDSLATLSEAMRLGSEDTYTSLEAIHYLNKGDKFTVLGFIGADREEALVKANAIKLEGIKVLLVRIP